MSSEKILKKDQECLTENCTRKQGPQGAKGFCASDYTHRYLKFFNEALAGGASKEEAEVSATTRAILPHRYRGPDRERPINERQNPTEHGAGYLYLVRNELAGLSKIGIPDEPQVRKRIDSDHALNGFFLADNPVYFADGDRLRLWGKALKELLVRRELTGLAPELLDGQKWGYTEGWPTELLDTESLLQLMNEVLSDAAYQVDGAPEYKYAKAAQADIYSEIGRLIAGTPCESSLKNMDLIEIMAINTKGVLTSFISFDSEGDPLLAFSTIGASNSPPYIDYRQPRYIIENQESTAPLAAEWYGETVVGSPFDLAI